MDEKLRKVNDRRYHGFNPHLGYERLTSEGTQNEQRKEVSQRESHKEIGSNRSQATPSKASQQATASGKKAKKELSEKLRLPLFLKIAVVFLLLIVICLMIGIVVIAFKLSKADAELTELRNLASTTNRMIESTIKAQHHNEPTTIKAVTEKLLHSQRFSITSVSNDAQRRKSRDTVILKRAQELPPANAKTTREAMRSIRRVPIEMPRQKRDGILKIEEIPKKPVFISRQLMKTTLEAPIRISNLKVKDLKVTSKQSRINVKKSMRITQTLKHRQPFIEIPKEKSVSIAPNAAEKRKLAHVVISMETEESKKKFIPRETIRTTHRAPIEILKRESGADLMLRKREEISKKIKTISNNEEIFMLRESKSIVIPSSDAKHGKYVDIPRRFKRESPPSSEMRQISGVVKEKGGEIKVSRKKDDKNGEKHEENTEQGSLVASLIKKWEN